MKTNLKMLSQYLLSFILVFSVVSCDDFLEEPVLGFREEIKPLDPNNLNVGELESRLQGLLGGFEDDRMFNDNGYRTVWADTSVDIFSLPDFARDNALETYTQLPTSTLFDQVWSQHYFYIGAANNIITSLGDLALEKNEEDVDEDDEDDGVKKLKELVSTAYYMRAMLYFNLVKIFERPTIVDVNTPTTVNDVLNVQTTGNATPREVYDIIIADLKIVSSLATGVKNSQVVSKDAAIGLLGRVYLQIAGILRHDFVLDKSIYNFEESAEDFYGLALEQFNNLINSNRYSLEPVFSDIFDIENEGTQNAEMIYAIPFSSTGAGGGSDFGDGFGVRGGPPNGAFLEREYFFDFLYSFFDDPNQIPATGSGAITVPISCSDARFLRTCSTFNINDVNNSGLLSDAGRNIFQGGWGPFKLTKPLPTPATAQGDYDVDFPYLRYADILLMKAEVLIKLNGDLTEARELINQVRRRAYGFDPGEVGKTTSELLVKDEDGNISNLQRAIGHLNMSEDLHNVGLVETYLNGVIPNQIEAEDVPTIIPGQGISGTQPGFETPGGTQGVIVDLPDTLDSDGLLAALMRERRKEFAGEGLRKDTLIRNGILDDVVLKIGNGVMSEFSTFHANAYEATGQRSGGRKASDGYASFKYRWPIPQNQLDLDSNLSQNPGY